MECDAASSVAGSQKAHRFYELVVDGFIDKSEFLAGLERLNIDLGEDGLALTKEEQDEVLAHVFKAPDLEAPFEVGGVAAECTLNTATISLSVRTGMLAHSAKCKGRH